MIRCGEAYRIYPKYWGTLTPYYPSPNINFELSALVPINMLKKLLDACQTVDPDQKLHSMASDLGLYCLLRPVCPET